MAAATATAVNLRRSSAERHLVHVSDEMAQAVSKRNGTELYRDRVIV